MRILRTVAFGYERWNRARKAGRAIAFSRKFRAETVLLIGCDASHAGVRNISERMIAEALPNVTASGLEPDAGEWSRYIQADGLDLPFEDGAFDFIYANAVLEHVGGAVEQQQFMAEIDRVGASWMVTTPNRWFPIEAHHHILFSHWRASWCPTPTGDVTRLVGRRELKRLAPEATILGWPLASPTLTAVCARQSRKS